MQIQTVKEYISSLVMPVYRLFRINIFVEICLVTIGCCLLAGSAGAADRCVVVEYFTNFLCQPCTLSAAALDILTEEYPDSSLAVIRCRPLNGDPFYCPESAVRKSYYFYQGYPRVYFDGVVEVTGAPDTVYQVYQQKIENRLAVPSPLEMSLTAIYDSLTGGGQIIAQIEAVGSVDGGDLRLRYALLESGMVYQGKHYQETLQDMFPDAGGVSFEIDYGETFHDTVDFYLDELWLPEDCSQIDTMEIACVAYVQDDDSEEIYQSVQTPLELLPRPRTVNNLEATLSGSGMYVTWSPVTLDIFCRQQPVDGYRIYRCTDYYYNPGAAALLDSTTALSYLDSTTTSVNDLLENCFYYLCAEVDGRESVPSGAVGEIDHYIYYGK